MDSEEVEVVLEEEVASDLEVVLAVDISIKQEFMAVAILMGLEEGFLVVW